MKTVSFALNYVRWIFALALVAALGGCSAMTPGDMHAVTPVTGSARAGNTYILRGWIGVFSTGVDRLGVEINQTGVNAMVFQDDQWADLAGTIRKKFKSNPNPEPLVLVGHSYGADDIIRIARELNKDNIKVDLLLTLDPVTPPTVPSNVIRCVNLYQTNGAWDKLPFLRGVPIEADNGSTTQLANLNIRVNRTDLLEPGLDHFNIEKKEKIHQEIIKQVLATCPPREQWTMKASKLSHEIESNGLVAIPAGATINPTMMKTEPASIASPTVAPATQPSANSRASANNETAHGEGHMASRAGN